MTDEIENKEATREDNRERKHNKPPEKADEKKAEKTEKKAETGTKLYTIRAINKAVVKLPEPVATRAGVSHVKNGETVRVNLTETEARELKKMVKYLEIGE